MILSTRIGYVRSFSRPQTLHLSIPDGSGTKGYNAIVGRNNSGKSTLARYLRALTSDANITIGYEDRHSIPPELQLRWKSGATETDVALAPTASNSVFGRTHSPTDARHRFRYIPSRRPFTSEFNFMQALSAADYERNDYQNRRMNYQMYFDSSLAQTLATGLSDAATKTRIIGTLERLDPGLATIDVDNVAGRDVIRFKSASGKWHLISETGDGTTNLIRIAHTLSTLADNSTIVIDEPELSLHPQLQKRLHDVLLEVSRDHQVIVLTHSPHFVSWKKIADGSTLTRIYLHRDGYSRIAATSAAVLSRISSIAAGNITSRKYFDTVAMELFFSDAAVLVEGPDDVHYISNWIDATGAGPLPLMGYGCGGFSAIPAWADLCLDLGITCVELFDGDQRNAFENESARLRAKYPEASCFLLNRDDIRDKHARDAAGRETNQILLNGVIAS
jgi:ABC-type cobalamin/Fe3+-siderophores transport system ATPase subunit